MKTFSSIFMALFIFPEECLVLAAALSSLPGLTSSLLLTIVPPELWLGPRLLTETSKSSSSSSLAFSLASFLSSSSRGWWRTDTWCIISAWLPTMLQILQAANHLSSRVRRKYFP